MRVQSQGWWIKKTASRLLDYEAVIWSSCEAEAFLLEYSGSVPDTIISYNAI